GAHRERTIGIEQHDVGIEAGGQIPFGRQSVASRRIPRRQRRDAVQRQAPSAPLAEHAGQQVLRAAESRLRKPHVPPALAPALPTELAPPPPPGAWTPPAQHAGSLTTQPPGRASPACHRYSTSARERIGGFTLAYVPAGASTSSSRWPTVTSRRKSTFGNAAA